MISDNEALKQSGFDISVNTSGGNQRRLWRRFYDAQWDFRSKFIEDLIAGGETNALRLLSLMEKYERTHAMKQEHLISADDHKITLLPVPQTYETELTPAGVPGFRDSCLRGQPFSIPYHTPDAYVNFLVDVIDQTGPYDAILELGCGHGRNLLWLYNSGGPSGIPYFGGELTTSGVALAQRLGDLVPGLDLSVHPFDHLSPDLSFLPKVERLFVFTVHSLEQVHQIGQSFFETIAQAAPKVTVVHLEPFGFQVQNLGPATEQQREYFTENQWNLNLWQALNQAHTNDVIKLTFAALEMFFPASPTNATSIALWDKP